ncbi:MAG: hypothetical protein R3E79_51765 [Caldilineaceae bacterium]
MTNSSATTVLHDCNANVLCAQFADAYQTAQTRTGAITHTYRIVGHTVRLVFAGPALGHWAVPDSATPDVTRHLWDGAFTGHEPLQPWRSAEVGLRGEISTYSHEQILTAIQTDINAVSIFDRHPGRGFYWIDNLHDFVTSSLVYQPGAVHTEVHGKTALVRQLPCYQINLDSDLAGIPPVITQVIQQAGHVSIDEGHHETTLAQCHHPRL